MRDMLGQSNIFMVGADTLSEDFHERDAFFSLISGSETVSITALSDKAPPFKFGRMFCAPNLPEFRPEIEGLVELGLEMSAGVDTKDNTSLPAGYTYLGQFLDHDITFDKTEGFPPGILSINDIGQGRSPSLDLDSLYGLGPELEMKHPDGRRIYQDDGVKLRVGKTSPDGNLSCYDIFDNDLPRGDFVGDIYQASIGDARNDENLAVAQTHLAFIKFHNAVVDRLRIDPANKNLSDEELFKKAREQVVRHYQWVVLHDFLPRIVEPEVLNAIISDGCKHFLPKAGEEPFMPFEFSGAAFRLGHSLVREKYEWNKFFHVTAPALGKGGVADLSELFRRTGFRGRNLGASLRLPSTWIVDWTNLFDFADLPGHTKNLLLNFTQLIDTSLSPTLSHLPFPSTMPKQFRSLAVINLWRGWLIGVPSAQSVVERLSETSAIKRLTPDEIAADHSKVRAHGLHKLTPLWYYILREAKEFHRGERLGPVGSHIVAETLVGLIRASTTSILRKEQATDPDWQPNLGQQEKRFDMPDLLYFVNDLNPLGKL